MFYYLNLFFLLLLTLRTTITTAASTIIANNVYKYLKEQGTVLVEIGYNQAESVEKIFAQTHQYDKIRCIKDLSRNDRVIEISI